MKTESLQKAVEEQVLDSYEAMYRLAYMYVRNEEDALDIVQESVYKAFKNAGRIKEVSYVRTWLWRIVMNTAVDFLRKSQREQPLAKPEELGAGEAGSDFGRDFDTLEALNVLDEREKAVIVLRFFEDQKLEEIARVLDENLSTVKGILYRSLKKLKVELTEGELRYEG